MNLISVWVLDSSPFLIHQSRKKDSLRVTKKIFAIGKQTEHTVCRFCFCMDQHLHHLLCVSITLLSLQPHQNEKLTTLSMSKQYWHYKTEQPNNVIKEMFLLYSRQFKNHSRMESWYSLQWKLFFHLALKTRTSSLLISRHLLVSVWKSRKPSNIERAGLRLLGAMGKRKSISIITLKVCYQYIYILVLSFMCGQQNRNPKPEWWGSRSLCTASATTASMYPNSSQDFCKRPSSRWKTSKDLGPRNNIFFIRKYIWFFPQFISIIF